MTLTAEEKINNPVQEIHEAISLILNMAVLKVGLDGVEKASPIRFQIQIT